jgi:peptide/nickel transport system permease protein
MESQIPPTVKTETLTDVRSPLDVSRLSFKSVTDRPARVRGRLTVWIASGWLVLITLLAIVADLLPIADYRDLVGRPRQKAFNSWSEPFGLDALGRSELSRAIYGARVSLVVGVAAVLLGMLVGTALGLLAGYFRGAVDALLGIVTDAFLAFPALVLLLAIAATMGASLRNLVVALAILTTPAFVRLARANTMVFANREFIRAARGMGARHRRIILRELLPNVALPVASYAFVLIAVVLVAEGSLSFLGLGVPPPRPSWGEMISTGRNDLDRAPHVVFVPAAFMFLTVWSFNVLGDHARRRFDTRESML